MREAYAILTPEGWYTPYRTVDPDGPPKLYKTEANAQRQIDNAWKMSQLYHGVVTQVVWGGVK